MNSRILIKNGLVVHGVDVQTDNLDILIEDGSITKLAKNIVTEGLSNLKVIDATDKVVIPGLIQTHIHLCQTIFRGSADDLELLDWLRERVWPMEAAHNPASLAASAKLAVAEMIKSGTTAALTMETVHDTEVVLESVAATGFRATIGKCMMDKGSSVPPRLQEETRHSIDMALDLMKRWQDKAGVVRYCFAPRFAVSCTQDLLVEVAKLARENGVLVHTHASENLREIEIVQSESGYRNIEYLHQVGLSGAHIGLAHCIHVDEKEQELLASTKTNVLHCPSSNLKLGSGIAPITDMLAKGVSVSLGADGTACNNNLDGFTEMRLAALLQKMRYGSSALPAREAFQMATIAGARALGMEQHLGTIDIGKKADIVILDLNNLHCTPAPDIISTVVYAARSSDVETVLVNGRILMENRQLQTMDELEIIAETKEQFRALRDRAGI